MDAIISDGLNHASLIDGIRLSTARRYRFASRDLNEFERHLKAARADGARPLMIATDGVFSMDGSVAPLAAIAALADRYDALVLIDDCHATGIRGPRGRGRAAQAACRVDLITSTFEKALGGAMGGFVAGPRSVIELLRRRARPYLFSNALAPAVCGASLAALAIANADEGDARRARLECNAARWRAGLTEAGFELLPGSHPIVPVMLGEARLAQAMARDLLTEGIGVTGFAYPVVPDGQARIRTQLSAAHTPEQIDQAVAALTKVGRPLGVVRRRLPATS